jgi:hypothetical protein
LLFLIKNFFNINFGLIKLNNDNNENPIIELIFIEEKNSTDNKANKYITGVKIETKIFLFWQMNSIKTIIIIKGTNTVNDIIISIDKNQAICTPRYIETKKVLSALNISKNFIPPPIPPNKTGKIKQERISHDNK